MSAYRPLLSSLSKLSEREQIGHFRNLARTDLYFLLRYVFGRTDIEHPWLYDRCREIQGSPNGYLDLWAREHRKSTIITFAKTIQDILASHGENPLPEWNGVEPTFGLFSHTRPIAKKFARQIQMELETNKQLIEWFPDVLYENASRDAPSWSLDAGLVVRRKTNPKEATVEAWGLVDGQPTGAHFYVRVYDDVVTRSSVTTPEMIAKTTEAWELSDNLGVSGGIERYIGTRYHYNDTYKVMMDRQVVTPRIHAATVDGTVEGSPVLLSEDELGEKRRKQGPYTFACQQLLNPKADETQGFREEWLKYYKHHNEGRGLNIIILVDPASKKRKKNDYTSLWVIGLGPDRNYMALDFVRDRLNLTQRTSLLFRMHRKWSPKLVGYEEYGLQADIEHMQSVMETENYRFPITPLGGSLGNFDRVQRLIPTFEQGRIYLPESLHYTISEGKVVDLVQVFLNEEYKPFPVGMHADMLDSLSRIHDKAVTVTFPKAVRRGTPPREPVAGAWMG